MSHVGVVIGIVMGSMHSRQKVRTRDEPIRAFPSSDFRKADSPVPVGKRISYRVGPGFGSSNSNSLLPTHGDVKVWDTQYLPASKASNIYREAIGRRRMPWHIEFSPDREFQARVEMAEIDDGLIARHRCSPHVMIRTFEDVANSAAECFYLMLVLSGQSKCMQCGRSTSADSGDVLVFDSAWPVKVTLGPTSIDVLTTTIPKTYLGAAKEAVPQLTNVILDERRTPLSKCLTLIAERMIAASYEELASLYVACLCLLPLEAGCLDPRAKDETHCGNIHHLLREIVKYIDENIEDEHLAPTHVAHKFGISIRYVHKLFEGCGMSFCSYVTAKRLDYICKDLVSLSSCHQPISSTVCRWGFSDISSFNRAFKNRFGCTPTQFRVKFKS